MAFDNYVHNVLIVSGSDKGKVYFKTLLIDCPYTFNTKVMGDSQEVRRNLLTNDYELIIINSPLSDESGQNLAIYATEHSNALVLLVVKAEGMTEVEGRLRGYGIMVIGKPFHKEQFFQTIQNILILQGRKREYELEIKRLKERMEEMRIVGKAKCLLIEHMHITEEEAHKLIEKKAMDTRDKKINVAMEIIREYSY